MSATNVEESSRGLGKKMGQTRYRNKRPRLGEPRTNFPNQEHRESGEPFSPQEFKAAASRLSPGKCPGLDGIPKEVVRLITKKVSAGTNERL